MQHQGMESLNSYIKSRSGDSIAVIAEDLGVSRPYLYDLMKGRREPSLKAAVRMQENSGGEVMAKDWPSLQGVFDGVRRAQQVAS